MVHEYALEPALLGTWERFRYLTEKFGMSQGRLISRYPRRWKALVYEAIGACSELDRKRIEEKLARLDDRMMTRVHAWDAARDWLSNAETEHAVRPFQCILAATNPRTNATVLVNDQLEEETPRWKVSRGLTVRREAPLLADAIAPVLRVARRIVFVDPHFDPYRAQARNTLAEYLARAKARDVSVPIEQIEFHTRFNDGNVGFDAECTRRLPQRIPNGMRVRFVRWRERNGGEGLHNRYVLTERGGLSFAWGLDEGAASETDDLQLLDDAVYRTRWAQYCGENPAFDLAAEIVIQGTLR